jgi:hypothetical protein
MGTFAVDNDCGFMVSYMVVVLVRVGRIVGVVVVVVVVAAAAAMDCNDQFRCGN